MSNQSHPWVLRRKWIILLYLGQQGLRIMFTVLYVYRALSLQLSLCLSITVTLILAHYKCIALLPPYKGWGTTMWLKCLDLYFISWMLFVRFITKLSDIIVQCHHVFTSITEAHTHFCTIQYCVHTPLLAHGRPPLLMHPGRSTILAVYLMWTSLSIRTSIRAMLGYS